MTADVVVTGVAKAWNRKTVLSDLDLSVAHGEIVAVLGRSGGGKTTLLRIIAGLEVADRGTVAIGGVDVTGLRPAARNLGMIVQQGGVLPHLTVADNIGFALPARRTSTEYVEAVRRAAALAGCRDLLDRSAATLSGGEQQRTALARALVRQPQLVLLDEPLSSLDADERAVLRSLLRRALVEAGTTAIHVTHDQDEAFAIGDRVAVIEDGRIAQIGTADELYGSPETLGVATLVGAQRLNVYAPGDANPLAPQTDSDARHVVAIRPSSVRVVDPDDQEAVAVGEVVAVEARELSATVHVDVAATTVRAVAARRGRPAVGARVGLVVESSAWMRFDAETGRAIER